MSLIIIFSFALIGIQFSNFFDNAIRETCWMVGASLLILTFGVLNIAINWEKCELKSSESKSNIFYTGNIVPGVNRFIYFMGSTILLTYGLIGLLNNDIYIPGKSSSGGKHFRDYDAVLIYISFVFLSINFIARIIDHYDKRDNECIYKGIFNVSLVGSWFFFVYALANSSFKTFNH